MWRWAATAASWASAEVPARLGRHDIDRPIRCCMPLHQALYRVASKHTVAK
jgi:hypothetical protein